MDDVSCETNGNILRFRNRPTHDEGHSIRKKAFQTMYISFKKQLPSLSTSLLQAEFQCDNDPLSSVSPKPIFPKMLNAC